MPHLEPTYLRYIYDGLVKGSIHPENAAELPDGLIGMYEEALDERTSVVERQKLLQRFAIWAVLKKEVSAAFVAEILGETEDDIQEFISTYSAWFNSPESGKYQLYHERLKVYLLQKLSEGEVHTLHEKLITRLERAIEEQKADEFEWYGLEFLTSHLAVATMLNGDGKKLIDLAYSQTRWQRQLKISKGYSWAKNGLKEVMSWASKYNDDEVIECGLQMVDLHQHEQNAEHQIVALVAEGEFEAALKRIEQFGGSDKEGLQRKFILYMLCLMELTILESKDKPNRKVGIEKLLKHLDGQLPVDHSVLNWGEFFSGHLIFLMAGEAYELGLEFGPIIKRTEDFDFKWIESNGPYSPTAFIVIERMSLSILGKERKQEFTKYFLVGLAINKQFKHINSVLRKVDIELKDEYLDLIATTLASKRKIEKSIHYALKINDATDKNLTLIRITNILLESNKYTEAKEVLPHLTIRYYRVVSLCLFSDYLFKSKTGNHLNALNQAIKICETIQNDSWLIMAKRKIAATFITQRKFNKGYNLLTETFHIETNNVEIEDFYLTQIIELFAQFKRYDFAFKISSKIIEQSKRLNENALLLVLKGKVEEGFNLFKVLKEKHQTKQTNFLIILIQKGKYSIACKYANQIENNDSICDIALSFLEAGKIELLDELLKARCTVFWDNPKKQLIQLIIDEYRTFLLDDVITINNSVYGSLDSLEILVWINSTESLKIVFPITYKLIVDVYNSMNKVNVVKEVLYEQTCLKNNLILNDMILQKKILKWLNKNESFSLAVLLLENITNVKDKLRLINTVIDREIENQYPSFNEQKIKQIFTPIIDDIALKDFNFDLAKYYLKLNEIKKLENYLKNNSNSYGIISELIYIAEFFNNQNNFTESDKYVNLAIEEIKNHDENEDKCSWYCEIALITFNNKDVIKSNNFLKQSVDYLKLSDEINVGIEMFSIVPILCKHEQFIEAINLIDKIDEYWQNINYCHLIPLLISNGKEIFLKNIINGAIKQLDKIKLLIAASAGYFGIKNYENSSHNMDSAIILAEDINDLTEQSEAFEAISNEFVNQENWQNAVTFIEKVLLKQNQLDLAISLGKKVSSLKKSEEIEIISSYFYDENLKLVFWKGVVKEINLESIDLMMIIHNLKRQTWNPNMFLEFYQLEILKQIFMNRISSHNEEKLLARLNLEWAIEIKNQLPN